MAAANTPRKPCGKCNKGAGVFTCDGCRQSFCRKHTDEHRQDLSVQMDNIAQEHDLIQRDFNKEVESNPLLTSIDVWEQESIKKIQQTAQQARNDLRQLIEESKKGLKKSMVKLTGELQSSGDYEDYTEFDLKRWTDRLKQLRSELEKPSTLSIIDNDDRRAVIHLIKVIGHVEPSVSNQLDRAPDHIDLNAPQPIIRVFDKFGQTDEKSLLSENGLLVTYLDENNGTYSSVRGIRCYSHGIHYIRFRVEQKNSKCMFFGITTDDLRSSTRTVTASSSNGWWELDCHIKDGNLKEKLSTVTIQTGDEITLLIDCTHRQIHLKHHRTKRTVKMSVDLQKCSFPWRILVVLNAQGDCVRILETDDLS